MSDPTCSHCGWPVSQHNYPMSCLAAGREQPIKPDYNMIRYFIEYKDDVERYIGWEREKAQVAIEKPELIAALMQVRLANLALKAIVDTLPSEAE